MKTSHSRPISSSGVIASTPSPSNSVSLPPPRTCACSASVSSPSSEWIAPCGVGDADDGAAELRHDPRRPRADVAEALDDDARVGGLEAERRRGLAEHVDEAAAGGRLAAVGALERDRLAGHDRRRVAVQLAVLVHHPGHRLRVGADVRRRDVARRAEHLLDLVDERARDLLQLVLVAARRVDVDAALRAAERDPRHGRLPGHQRRQRAHLVEVDLGVVADAALVRPARAVVLDAEAGEDVDLPVGQRDRDLHLHLAVGGAHDGAQVVAQLHPVGREVEPVVDDVVVRDLGGGHRRELSFTPAGGVVITGARGLCKAEVGVRFPSPPSVAPGCAKG